MIDRKAVELELAQARQARIDAQLAGCEVEELADSLRQTRAAGLASAPARRAIGPRLFVFAP